MNAFAFLGPIGAMLSAIGSLDLCIGIYGSAVVSMKDWNSFDRGCVVRAP